MNLFLYKGKVSNSVDGVYILDNDVVAIDTNKLSRSELRNFVAQNQLRDISFKDDYALLLVRKVVEYGWQVVAFQFDDDLDSDAEMLLDNWYSCRNNTAKLTKLVLMLEEYETYPARIEFFSDLASEGIVSVYKSAYIQVSSLKKLELILQWLKDHIVVSDKLPEVPVKPQQPPVFETKIAHLAALLGTIKGLCPGCEECVCTKECQMRPVCKEFHVLLNWAKNVSQAK